MNGQIVSSNAAYGKFIKQQDSPWHWRTPQDTILWNAGTEEHPVKSANDPCPDGWRLPSKTELSTLVGSGEWGGGGYRFYRGMDTLFLPFAGERKPSSGYIDTFGGYYWSSTPYVTNTISNDNNSASVLRMYGYIVPIRKPHQKNKIQYFLSHQR